MKNGCVLCFDLVCFRMHWSARHSRLSLSGQLSRMVGKQMAGSDTDPKSSASV